MAWKQETVAIVGVGATLGILIIGLASFVVTGQYSTGAAIAEVRRDVADLRERMARLEGLFEGFTKRPDGSPRTNPTDTR